MLSLNFSSVLVLKDYTVLIWNKREQYQLYRPPCGSVQGASSSSLQNYYSGQEKGKMEAAHSIVKRKKKKSLFLPFDVK